MKPATLVEVFEQYDIETARHQKSDKRLIGPEPFMIRLAGLPKHFQKSFTGRIGSYPIQVIRVRVKTIGNGNPPSSTAM